MLRISADAAAYACRSTGKCCKGWQVQADRQTAEALPGLLKGIPRYEGVEVLGPRTESLLHARDLDFSKGQCVFQNPDERCDLHARFGPAAKPLICRQYPYLAIQTPLGIEISLTYSCPSAAALLLGEGPLRILKDPPQAPDMAYTKGIPEHYPVQVDPLSPLTWEGFHLAGDLLRGLLSSGGEEPSIPLAFARMSLEKLREGGGPRGPAEVRAAFSGFPGRLPVPSPTEIERLASECLGGLFQRRRMAGPWEADALNLGRLESFAQKGWMPLRKAWAGSPAWNAYRRYLSAKCFGNLLFVSHGMIPAFQVVLLLGLTVRLEAARRATEAGRGVLPRDVADAAEVVERLFPHESGIFDFWARKGGALESTAPGVSAALLLAGLDLPSRSS